MYIFAHEKTRKVPMKSGKPPLNSTFVIFSILSSVFNMLLYGSPSFVPFSFALNARAKKKLREKQRNKICLAWPRVQQRDQFYWNCFKTASSTDFADCESGSLMP